jgi:hypothetical protein
MPWWADQMLCDSAHWYYPTLHCTLPAHISSERRILAEFFADPASITVHFRASCYPFRRSGRLIRPFMHFCSA